jgi:hypothetical protein
MQKIYLYLRLGLNSTLHINTIFVYEFRYEPLWRGDDKAEKAEEEELEN